jgi:hypothetical protein
MHKYIMLIGDYYLKCVYKILDIQSYDFSFIDI